MLSPSVGSVIAHRYQLVSPLGHGSQGTVWLAADTHRQGVTCALKLLDAATAHGEAETLLRIEHPALPKMLDAGTHGSLAFLALEYIQGAPLSHDHDLKTIVRAVADVASGLARLHDAGITHGDVKPANILVAADRACLVDLGLSATIKTPAATSGTLAFMAPEILAGERSGASDLWALGVTLCLVLARQHPLVREAGDRDALLTALSRSASPEEAVFRAVPEALRAAVASLLAVDPERRPSAEAFRFRWLRDGSALTQQPAPIATEGSLALHGRAPLTGRDRERDETLRALEQALDGHTAAAVVLGPAGAGKRRLVDEALRAFKIRHACDGAIPEVRDALPEVIHRPTVVRMVDASPEQILAVTHAIARLRRFGASALPVALLASATESVRDDQLTRIDVAPLDRSSASDLLAALHGERLSPHAMDAWIDVTAGLPGRIVTLAQSFGTERLGALTREALRGRAAALHRARLPEDLSSDATTAAIALGIADEALDLTTLSEVLGHPARPALAELTRRGVIVFHGASATLAAPIPLDELASDRTAKVASRLASVLDARHPERLGPRASASLYAGSPDAAERCLRAANAPELTRAAAVRWLELGARVAPDRAAYDLTLARALVLSGDPLRALDVLRSHPRTSASSALEADALRRAGSRDEARALALRLVEDPSDSVRAVGRMVMARDALDRGDFLAADRALGPQLADGIGVDAAVRVRALECGALVALAADDLTRAHERLARADAACLSTGDGVARARVRSLQGMICQRRGAHAEARRLYEDAWTLATHEGDTLGAATYLLNRGGAELECGALGESARCLEHAAQMLASGHRLGELARALANLASLREFLGDRAGAADAARRATDAARLAGDAVTEGFSRAIEASAKLTGAEAVEGLILAARRLEEGADSLRSEETRARAATLLVELGDLDRAEKLLTSGTSTALGALVMASVACARRPPHQGLIELRLGRARELARRDASVEHELWLLRIEAQAAEALGRREEAARFTARRSARLEALAATLPASVAGLFLEAHTPARRAEITLARGASSDTHDAWRRLAAITRKLNTEPRLHPLLELVMDSVIELTGAARGFLLLREKDGALKIRTARNIGRRDLEGDETLLSRSVAERVMREGEALVTVDAAMDGRLDAFASVHAMRLRSILAVPLGIGGEAVGTIYLDDRYRAGAFGEQALELARAFSDAAAVAIQNARIQTELRRALSRAEHLTRELTRTVDAQRVELEVTRSAMGANAPRGRHESIIGQGQAMSRTLALVDRVAPTGMPVLLQGESGTGKELIARAIHASSSRATRTFVAENCGAIPETLLESVLFGHVKGAFTGADRARAGLFEIADGGTLLLDEIGEMSPAMQSRLLRVLQEGEVRPVGGQQSRKVDVRVIAATHRNLHDMVAHGTFREDLFYRLAVMVLPIPALRERREDIPALVAHFVERHCPAGTSIDRRAMAVLAAAPWPGNVRQLQNEIQRAGALCDGTIRQEHFSPEVASGLTTAASMAMEARESARQGHAPALKNAVEDVERSLVEQALRDHGGNQSRAARALGLSRFGLQKKLKRLGIVARRSETS